MIRHVSLLRGPLDRKVGRSPIERIFGKVENKSKTENNICLEYLNNIITGIAMVIFFLKKARYFVFIYYLLAFVHGATHVYDDE